MLECIKIRNQISQYIDKELDEKNTRLFEKHIGTCEECRNELQEMLSIVAILQSTEDLDLPEDFRMEFHNKLVEESNKPASKKDIIGNFGKWAAILSSAAAVLIVAFLFKGVWSNMLDTKSNSKVSPVTLGEARNNAEEKVNNDNGTVKRFADNYKADNSTQIQVDSSEHSDGANNYEVTYNNQPTEKIEMGRTAAASEEPGGDSSPVTDGNGTEAAGDNLSAANAVTAAPPANNSQGAAATYGSTAAATDNADANKNTSEAIISGRESGDQTENIKRLVADCGGEIVSTTVTTTSYTVKSASSDSGEKAVNARVKNSEYGKLVEQLEANYGSENLIITEINHEDNTKKVDELNTTLKNIDSQIDESQKNGALPDSKELQDLNNRRTAVNKEIEDLISDSDYTYITITIKNIKQ